MDTTLLESVDELYYTVYSLITNKYGILQTRHENFATKLELLNENEKENDKK